MRLIEIRTGKGNWGPRRCWHLGPRSSKRTTRLPAEPGSSIGWVTAFSVGCTWRAQKQRGLMSSLRPMTDSFEEPHVETEARVWLFEIRYRGAGKTCQGKDRGHD